MALGDDPAATIQARFAVLEDDTCWRPGRDWARIHYEAELLVEFLLDVKGHTPEEVIADQVTREETVRELASWCRQTGITPPAAPDP